jgi:hypothetical protein
MRMTFVGLSLEDSRDAGGHVITYFAIPAGRESAAAGDLLGCLAAGWEVCLRNDLDEGGEGCTFFRRSPSGLVTMTSGHGWQGEWRPLDEAGVLAAVVELAGLNRGGHWSTRGSISRSKSPAE